MSDEILALFPEIGWIKDPGLREKTRSVWAEAIARGGWAAADLGRIPFTLLIKKTSVSLLEHTRAVTQTAYKIAEVLLAEYGGRVRIDLDALVSGAVLHDVGKLFEFKREAGAYVKSREGELLRHPVSGAAIAFERGLPGEVLHIIAAHSKEGDGSRRTIEAIIVNHADFVNFDVFKE